MKLEYSKTPSVDLATAKRRALRYLTDCKTLAAPSGVAAAIWPGHDMTNQGAGGAASRILKIMEEEGTVVYHITATNWGWRLA